MLEFAKNEFELMKRQPDGCTLRAHLESAERMRRVPMPELHVECPPLLRYVWQWFWELHRARSGNGMGPNPISYAEIASWAHLTRLRPTPVEVALLRHLDSVYLQVQSEKFDA